MKIFCQNELDKAYFGHDMAYGDFKDLNRRTASDKVLRDKAFNIAKNPIYDEYQHGLFSIVYKFFDKKTSQKNYRRITQLLDNLRKEKYTLLS